MSTFQVQPSATYNIAIGAPGVAGTPSPTITYSWTYNGASIGTNSRFVNGYTFPSLPGTLACTITLTNIAGSVSQTVTATIEQVSNLPSLSPVTIRNNAEPTVPISTIANGNAGVVLRVGGPNSSDLNPVAANASSIAYQWRRDASNIAGETGPTYTVAEEDEDKTITCVVTASNPDGSSSRTASVRVGSALPNDKSHIGTHISTPIYYGGEVKFANLIYSSISDIYMAPEATNKYAFGILRFADWSGPPYFTEDGWPYRNDNGPLSTSNPCTMYLVLNSPARLWSALGLTGEYTSLPTAEQTGPDKAVYTPPEGIAGRTFTFTVTCYWEGVGVAVAGGNDPNSYTTSTVLFSGPDGSGPFGDGPRTMSRSVATFGTAADRINVHIVASDASGANPLRNLIVLVSNVRDAATGELLYAGFDHTTYQPFQLYPQFVESMRHFSHIRSLASQWQHDEPSAARVIFNDTGLRYEFDDGDSTPLVTCGWDWPQPSAPGFKRGFGAINRPTNIVFGNSLRAYIEICNQLDADLWWCHPVPTVFVGTRDANGSITYARLPGIDPNDPNKVGRLLVDEAYAQGFADEIASHLKPGLRVYSEWGNEVWNWGGSYWHGSAHAYASVVRAIAPVEYGGDDGLWFSAQRILAPPAIHSGVRLAGDRNAGMAAFSAAASAMLAEAIRERLGAESEREIVCVASGQDDWLARSSLGLGQFWAAMPKLFKQLDAVAHAPYRSWWGTSAERDAQLAEGGYSAAWEELVERGALLPYALSPGGAVNPNSMWGTNWLSTKWGDPIGYPHQRAWKNLALDRPEPLGVSGRISYTRRATPPGWPAGSRRWNLDLITYEGGNHHIPVSSAAKLESYPGTLHPNYRPFTLRYMEMIFGHGPRGLARDPANADEEAIYRPGMVPLGVIEDAEPLHDRFTFLTTTDEPSFRHGNYWALQWWNSHRNAPQAEGVRSAVGLGVGELEWWLTYTGDSE